MKINIYYGGRGIVDDPALYVINKMQKVLEELNVNVERFILHELRNSIPTLPQTLKGADGVILATTIEWYGVGGYMQQFLDACWLYGDKEKISSLYMFPVVMSTTYGEQDGKRDLTVAWEILGGLPSSGLCGYIEDTLILEMNPDYVALIEKKAENLYRTIKQKVKSLPVSNHAVKQKITVNKLIDLTPQETEQLSHYISDDTYVKKQKEDILELTSYFKDMLGNKDLDDSNAYVKGFNDKFTPQAGFKCIYKINISGRKQPLIINVAGSDLQCFYGILDIVDVEMQLSDDIMRDITFGRLSFQRAFMNGSATVKGDFKALRMLDKLFDFKE